MKFNKNDTVVYGNNGICIVEDIKTMKFGTEGATYYVLKPKSNAGSTLYVPADKENLVAKMRHVLTKEEIDEILARDCADSMPWQENKTERNEKFNKIITGGNISELIMMIKCLHMKKQEKLNLGKQLSSNDELALKTAEKLVDEEFTFSLGCSCAQVEEYIKSRI